MLPQVLERAEVAAPDVDPAITRAIGAVPGPYLNYIFHPDKMLAKKLGKRTRAEELIDLQDELLAEFESALTLVRNRPAWPGAKRAGTRPSLPR